ncbi:MAG TPA: alpha/beta hydrolase [Gemmatimonadales bacterium]|nr:alpha/beta hydrolase [Gemmatimonadales bacterium]
MRSILENRPTRRMLAALTLSALLLPAVSQAQSEAGPWGSGAGKSKPNGHYADVNGVHLYYEIHGTGKPLVLLHGGLGAIEMFGPNLPLLAEGRQVIAVDLYGHGRTALVGDRPLDPALMADDIAALIAHLELGKADVMGYSLGAGVALQTAIRHPEVVDRLVAASAIFKRSGFYPEILEAQKGVTAEAAEAMKQTPMYQVYSALAPRPEDWPVLLERIGAFMLKDYDYSAEIAGIKAPTLVAAGDADIAPPSHAVELFGLLGGGKRDGGWDGSGQIASQLAIVPGVTHYTMFSDPRLAEVAIRFLDHR